MSRSQRAWRRVHTRRYDHHAWPIIQRWAPGSTHLATLLAGGRVTAACAEEAERYARLPWNPDRAALLWLRNWCKANIGRRPAPPERRRWEPFE